MKIKIQCPFCFEKFQIQAYEEDGHQQEIVYDCEVCCHPIDLHLFFDEETQRFQAVIEKSSGF